MKEEMLTVLIKIFKKREYAEEFIKGKMFCRKLKEFNTMEEGVKIPLREDRYEGVNRIFNHKQWEAIITLKNNTKFNFKSPSPMTVSYNDYSHFPVYCMFAISSSSYGNLVGDRIQFYDKRLKEFGDTCAIVTDIPKFHERLQRVCNKHNIGAQGRLVNYVDIQNYDGVWGAFSKSDEYSYQSEYRILFERKIQDNHIDYNIGDLSKFTLMVKTDDLINALTFKQKDDFYKLDWINSEI